MRYFQMLPKEAQDIVRLDVFIEEGRGDLVAGLFLKYKGRLMDIVINNERARELYIALRMTGKTDLAFRFTSELGLDDRVVDSFEMEYRNRIAIEPVKPAPSVKALRELIDLYK